MRSRPGDRPRLLIGSRRLYIGRARPQQYRYRIDESAFKRSCGIVFPGQEREIAHVAPATTWKAG